MTSHEKAVSAVNTRLERLQANLREAKGQSAQRFLFQSIVVTIGVAEALNDYVKAVGQYAQRRHGQVKQTNDALGAQHADLLKAGQALLQDFKANPLDRSIQSEIERAQRNMAAIQKTLRRAANQLQRELAPSLAMIDHMAVSVRRLSEADESDALKRLLKTLVEQLRGLYAAQMAPAKDVIDAASWGKSAVAEIEQSVDFYDAYARTGYQATLGLELAALAVSENPPRSAGEAMLRANEAVSVRLKNITARFTPNEPGT